MKPLAKIRAMFPGGGENGSRLSVPLSAPLAAALSLVLVCAVAWAFFMGYLVGQGQNPRASINDMTGGFLVAEENPEEANGEVFLETPEEPSPAPERTAESPPVKTAAAAPAPFSRPEGSQKEAWGEKNTESRPKQKTPTKPRAVPPKDAPTYDYSFQIAALKSAADAEKMRQTLKNLGIRAKTQRSGKVVLVLASLRGNDADARALRQKLAARKLGSPLLLSKTPTQTQKTGKKS